jgi:hypothetical protein
MRADGLPVSSAAALLGLATGGIDIFVMLVTGPLINGGATASPDQDMAADVGANLIGPRFFATAFMLESILIASSLLLAASLVSIFPCQPCICWHKMCPRYRCGRLLLH